jgi:two-component system, OmpR family, sensor histidine kinase CreC
MSREVVAAASALAILAFLSFIVVRLLRSRKNGLSVRMQVFLALGGIVFAFALGLGLLVIDRVKGRASRLAEAAATDEAHALVTLIESELQNGSSLERISAGLERTTRRSLARRRSQASGFAEAGGLEILDAEGRLLLPVGEPSRTNERGAVVVEAAILGQGKRVGIVRVIKPTLAIERMLADIAPTVLVLSLVLGGAAALAALWIGRTIAQPIEGLTRFAERVSQGHREPIIEVVQGREVRRLVHAIDTMRRQLEGRPFVETFAADLSHELKNPVAALLASAEVLEDGALDEPEQARHFVARIREAAERIESLLEELLDLAEVETHGLEARPKIDLAKALAEAMSLAPQVDARVQCVAPGGAVPVRGHAPWLVRALHNLIQNALVHSPEGSLVRVELRQADRNAIITVRNDGQVAPHVRSELFRRFVTTRRDLGGNGLGLSIIRAVAEAHGGQVEIRSWGPPEVVFELQLPLAG